MSVEEAEALNAEALNEAPAEQANEISEAEVAARKQGWTPKEEFAGDEARWVDAETFVERGKEINSMLRKNNQKLEQKIDRMEQSVGDFKKYHEQTERRAYEKAKADLEQKAMTAVEDGDVEAYSAIRQEQENLEVPIVQADESNPDFDAWVTDNDWYNDDDELHIMADGYGQLLAGKGLVGRALYDAVAKKVKERAPEKFGKRQTTQSVESGSPAPKPGKRTYANLPANAKAACDQFVADGYLTKEQYVKDYDWSQGDK